MTRALPLALALVLTGQTATAQGVSDAPRAITAIENAWELIGLETGYEDMVEERYGTPAQPHADELGLTLMFRILRNTCLGLESGKSVAEVTPPGFAAYGLSPYMMDAPDRGEGTFILSPTGDIDIDETEGHITIWVTPGPRSTSCKVEWILAEAPPEDRQTGMAALLADWMPFTFALSPAARPTVMGQALVDDFTEWDRPCGGQWCPFTALYRLSDGEISLETTLNTVVERPDL